MPAQKRRAHAPERGFKLAKARREVGLTQLQLAEKVGAGRVSIARIEAGVPPSVTLALAIARELNSSVEDLFGGER